MPFTSNYIVLFTVLIIANAIVFYAVYKLYNKKKLLIPKLIIFAVVTSIVTVFANSLVHNEPFTYLIVFGTVCILMMALLRLAPEDCILLGLFVVFHTMVFKGIAVGTLSLIIKKNMYQTLLETENNGIVQVASGAMLMVSTFIYLAIIKKESYQALISSKAQKFFVLIAQMILSLFMLFYSYNYYYNMEMIWFSVAQVLTSIIMWACYIVVARYGMTVARLLTVEIRGKQLQEKLESQLGQYHHYQELGKQIQVARHDVSELAISANYLIDQGKYKEAKDVIEESTRSIESNLPHIQKYSNNILMDALLTETRGICLSNDIAFNAKVYVPPYLSISEKNLHTCVFNLTQNAIEACERMNKDSMRFINIESSTKKNWLTIKVSNSYTGILKVHDGLIDSKKDTGYNGRGLKIVKETVESARGMVNIMVDKTKHIFTISIHIYYATPKGAEPVAEEPFNEENQ